MGAISGGQELVRLYQDSGLGGEASLSAQAKDKDALRLLLAIAAQRLRDRYVDDLQRGSGKARVHFPHLYIDLQRRTICRMPEAVRASVEAKIRRLERWTCIEKAYVLGAKHEQTVRFILAYALSRAKATGRSGAVWIPLGMHTGAQGHANAICLQVGRPGGPAKALVYDPNYASGQEHWVHAQKAVNDALPKVRQLLEGTGIAVPDRAELFGHGLQTSLGTTERQRGWFSSKVYTMQRGYPICGAVVHLLATVWLAASGGGALESLAEVESALAEIVATSPEGKALVQSRIAALLRGLTQRFGERGEEPFAQTLKKRLDADRKHWPDEVVRGGGSITMSGEQGRSCTYSW